MAEGSGRSRRKGKEVENEGSVREEKKEVYTRAFLMPRKPSQPWSLRSGGPGSEFPGKFSQHCFLMAGSCIKPPVPVSQPLTHLDRRPEGAPCPPRRDLLLVATGRSPSALRTESLLVRKGLNGWHEGQPQSPQSRTHSAERGAWGGRAGSTSPSEGPWIRRRARLRKDMGPRLRMPLTRQSCMFLRLYTGTQGLEEEDTGQEAGWEEGRGRRRAQREGRPDINAHFPLHRDSSFPRGTAGEKLWTLNPKEAAPPGRRSITRKGPYPARRGCRSSPASPPGTEFSARSPGAATRPG